MPSRITRRQMLKGAAAAAVLSRSAAAPSDAAAAAGGSKTLTMSWSNDFKTLDPPMVTASPDYNFVMQVFNGLVRYRPTSVDIEPDLAYRWDLSADGLTYTFYLRRGVMFHKGYGEMTADDVKFSFERAAGAELGSPYRQDMQAIAEIEVVNPYTVRLHMRNVDLDFLSATLAFRPGYIVSKKAVLELGPGFAENPVGTGAYAFEGRKPGEQATFTAHPNYFRGRPAIDRVIFRVIPDETVATLALIRNEIQFMRIVTPEGFAAVQRDPHLAYIATPATGTLEIYMLPHPPLDDIRIRRALSHAINRDEYINSFLHGLGAAPSWSVIPPLVTGHVEDVPKFPYDPAKAKALLAAAGFPNGRGLRPFTFVALDIYQSDAQAVQAYWGKVGVQLHIDQLASAAARARQMQGNLDFFFSAITRVVPSQFLQPFHSSYQPLLYGKIDSLIDAQRSELDKGKRLQILRQIQVRLADDVAAIPMYRPVQITAFRKEVTGNVPNTFFWLFHWERMNIG